MYVDIVVIVILTLSLYLPFSWAGFLRLIILVKLEEVVRVDKILFRRIHTRRSLKQLYLLFKLVLSLMYLNHLLGCLFYYMDYRLILSSYYGDVSLNPLRNFASIQRIG